MLYLGIQFNQSVRPSQIRTNCPSNVNISILFHNNGSLITESDVLKCISDEKCREMLANIQERIPLSISDLKLTRKQYYSRLHNLIICGLIQKTNGIYRLTSFGKIIFDWHLVIRDTISKEYWKLRAIDMLGSSGIPDSERSKVLDTLIGNDELKQFLSR